jgi:hypothetical protein
MADDSVTVALVLVLVAIGAAIFLETRFLRRKMKNRRVRAAKRDEEAQDEAHNAIVTTKAIIASLERQGIRTEESAGWLREAEVANARHNYRVAVELTGRAKARLLSLKSAQASKGDLAKLDLLSSAGSTEAMTTKEALQKDVPANLLQSKFSIGVAETALEEGRVAGRDTTQATQLLEAAKARFEAKDYAGALSVARLSKRAADGEVVDATIPVPVAAPPSATSVGPMCQSCGSPLHADDMFCRKCGMRVVSTACASCGASLLPDDAFCRKCGAPVSG